MGTSKAAIETTRELARDLRLRFGTTSWKDIKIGVDFIHDVFILNQIAHLENESAALEEFGGELNFDLKRKGY